MTDDEARAVIDTAWEAGVRIFDTAPHYGLGLAERRLGTALRDGPRDEFVLSTKVGRLLVPDPTGTGLDPEGFAVAATRRRVWDFSADGVRRSLESSLERLGLDRVDVVHVHDPDDHWEQAVGEAVPALVDLREQGVIGAVGVGMNQWQMLARFVRESDVDTVLLAGRYTLLEQPALAELLPLCVERGVELIAAGLFNSGLLARREVPDDATYDYRDAPADVVGRARRIAEVCARHGTTLPAAALWFPFGHPAVTGALIGARAATEVRANVAASAHGLGVRHVSPRTTELDNPRYAANERDRCYFCKSTVLDVITAVAREHGLPAVATGTNADDARDPFRPGIRAGDEIGVHTPLRDLGMSKVDVRAVSRHWNLSTWDKPAQPCLASRVRYGLTITPTRLARVERAEAAVRRWLADAGIATRDLRVRDLGDVGRVEFDPRVADLPEIRTGLAGVVRAAGFSDAEVAVFRSGTLNHE